VKAKPKLSAPIHDRPSGMGPAARAVASADGWSVTEYVCRSGPEDRPFEERHEAFTIAAVMEGSFLYRANVGTSLLHPGAFLLGNFGACFQCGHDHSRGDRCVAFHFSPDYFAEVSASAGGSAKFTFATGMMPYAPETQSWLVRLQWAIVRQDAIEIDEAITALIEFVVTTLSGEAPSFQRLSAHDVRRISAALQMIEENFSEAVTLDRLARVATMSKYHFLRTFRRSVGVTPYQYLLALRLRHAALRVALSSEPISRIAFDVGFGDLSTFIDLFRRRFGDSPSGYRARHRKPH
jgi:AraC family transcriptional regulator